MAALKQKGRKVVALALRQLLRLLREYPREPFLAAVQRSRAVWALRSRPLGAHDFAPRGARLLSLLERTPITMTEELEQLLKNLKLRRMLERL